MNPDDDKRDNILRFLFTRHKTTRGINKIPIGIRELQREMKGRYGMSQAEVSSNLDYLIQAGWVREVVKDRAFKTKGGMQVSAEQSKYKISEVGINHLEAGTAFRKTHAAGQVNITNIKGVTILGDGNIVNAQFTDLSRTLDELDRAIADSPQVTDAQKLEAAADLSTIRAQIAKTNPDRSVVAAAWKSLQAVATADGVIGVFQTAASLLAPLLQVGGVG